MGKNNAGRDWTQIYAIYGMEEWQTLVFITLLAFIFTFLSFSFLLYFTNICFFINSFSPPAPALPASSRDSRAPSPHSPHSPSSSPRQHLPLLRLPPLIHGPPHGQLGQRLVNGEDGLGPGLRARHLVERGGEAAEKAGELGESGGAGPAEHGGVDASEGGDGGGSGVRDVQGRGRAAAPLRGQLLRRGGVGGAFAQRGEGVRAEDGGGGGGEDEGGGGGGEGVEAGWGGGGVGLGARAGVRQEIARVEEDGGD
ncbi:hypothetical protein Syun_027325 [Stephania yunnanensis]|uniref:Uncharacterized protein n=1 Tax=Stephania yunnanensis TaxID=152371 RepID=A0AAP0HMQ0_9MAGN